MKGLLYIEPEGLMTDNQLIKWINLGLDFGDRGVLKRKKKKKQQTFKRNTIKKDGSIYKNIPRQT